MSLKRNFIVLNALLRKHYKYFWEIIGSVSENQVLGVGLYFMVMMTQEGQIDIEIVIRRIDGMA